MKVSEHVTLREPRTEDAINLATAANNPAIYAGLRDYFPHPYSVDDALHFIDTVLAKDGPPTTWFICVDGIASGVMSVFPGEDVYRYNAELGYWLAEPLWGQGIMTGVITATAKHAWTHLGVDRLYAEVFSSNQGSLRVLEKCGFRREYEIEGAVVKLGVRQSVICMGLRKPA